MEHGNEDRVLLISADGQHRIDSTVQEIVEMFEFVRQLMEVRRLNKIPDDQMTDYVQRRYSEFADVQDKSKS